MRLAVIGGGGFRVPLVYGALLEDTADLRVDEVVLHDVDSRRLGVVAEVLRQMAATAGAPPKVVAATGLDDALRGSDFVFSAIRVGGLAGRVADERVALDLGLLGQETTGPGGVAYGLRTVPVVRHLAERVAAVAPDAWVVNFTNPAGLVTEAMSAVLGDRVIGICDSPMAMCRRVARALDVEAGRAWFDYVGLNHLGWLRAVLVDGRDQLPRLLADEQRLRTFEEGRLFDAEWLRALGAVPNEYLWYWYAHREAVRAVQESGSATRGMFLREQQERFYETVLQDPSGALTEWQRVRRERDSSYMAESRPEGAVVGRDEADLDGGGYQQVALGVLAAIARNERAVHILDVRNRGAVPGLDDEAVVEVPCLVDANGAHPVAGGTPEAHQLGLLQSVKAVERETIAAAVEGSRERALRAFALHPLVDSVDLAGELLARYLDAAPELAQRFR
ncbi:MAG TPA: 6-phospho-beta-glucosidase [Jiangellales bacterium]|nr:6-phospho-beta-glucosidase [Jiangellales bacterium]